MTALQSGTAAPFTPFEVAVGETVFHQRLRGWGVPTNGMP